MDSLQLSTPCSPVDPCMPLYQLDLLSVLESRIVIVQRLYCKSAKYSKLITANVSRCHLFPLLTWFLLSLFSNFALVYQIAYHVELGNCRSGKSD